MKKYKEGSVIVIAAEMDGQSNHGCQNWAEYTRINNAWVCTAGIAATPAGFMKASEIKFPMTKHCNIFKGFSSSGSSRAV